MKTIKIGLVIGLVLLVGTFSQLPAATAQDATDSGQRQTIVYEMPYTFSELSYWTADSYATVQWNGAINAGLLTRSSENDRKYAPELASAMPTVHNATWFTLKLRPDLVFNTGNPLTADDVVFSYNVALTPLINLNSYGGLSARMTNASIVKIDDLTVDFHLPVTYAFANGLFSYPIIDQDLFQSDYDACLAGTTAKCDWNKLDYSTGTAGPYELESIDQTNNVATVVKNFNYWNAENVWAYKIVFKYVLEKTAAIAELADGTTDILDAQYKTLPNELLSVDGITETYVGDPAHAEMSLNHLNPYFGTGESVPDTGMITDNAEQARLIRKAMSHIVNREYISSEIEAGLSQPAATTMPSASLGWRSDVAYDKYNVTLAKQIMESVGFDYSTLTADGDSYADGFFDVVVLAPNSNPLRNQWAELISNELPKIGIHVTDFVNVDWDQIIPRTFGYVSTHGELVPSYADGGFDIMFVNYSWDLDWDPTGLYDPSGLVTGGSGDNFINFQNATITQTINDYTSELDVDKRIEIVGKLQEELAYQEPVLALTYPQSHWGWADDLVGIDSLLISISSQEWGMVRSNTWASPAVQTTPTSTGGPFPVSTSFIVLGLLSAVVLVPFYRKRK
jgi:peptide/nickel transport system substrate-binding protein